MVKCKICLEEKYRSKNFQHLHFHLLKKHGMTDRDYNKLYPNAPITSQEFKKKQKKLMTERWEQIPDLQEKQHAWRQEKNDIDYDDDFYQNPSFEDLETIKKREEWCCQMLGSGVKGEQYKSIYKDLMECRQAIEIIYDKLMRENL